MDFLENLLGDLGFAAVYGSILRYVFPILAIIILGRCAKSLLTFRKEP